jgi:hypothetical protein
MHPQLLSSLAAEHRRDLTASIRPHATAADSPAPARQRRRLPVLALPKLRVSWSRTTLAAVADARRSRSYVIVISATRPQ